MPISTENRRIVIKHSYAIRATRCIMNDQPAMTTERWCEIWVQQTDMLREEMRETLDMVKRIAADRKRGATNE
jgi:hypothetical protein